MASNELEVLDPATTAGKLKQIVSGVELSRRHFMAAVGAAGAAVGAGLLTAPTAHAQQASQNGFNQVDVLNFLLNIKFLKATFYSFIVSGTDLPATYATPEPTLGTSQMYNAPGKVTFTGPNAAQITDMFNEMYYDELNQVVDLQAALGAAALPRALINFLGNSPASTSGTAVNFNTGTPKTTTISPGQAIGMTQFLEDLSVTAVTGALPYLTGANLALASQVLAADGLHAGAVRLVSIQNNYTLYQYAGTESFSFTAGSPGGSNIIYGFLNPATPLQVGYVISTGATIATGGDSNAQDPTAKAGVASQPGLAGYAIVNAVGAIPSTYQTAYNGGSPHHSDRISGVSATDAAAWKVGMPVYDSGRYWPNPGTFITAIVADPSPATTYTVEVSASSGGHSPGNVFVGTTPITLSEAFPSEGALTVTTLGVPAPDPNNVLPDDIGPGVATSGPALNPPGQASSPLYQGFYQGFFNTAGSNDATTVVRAGLSHVRSFSQVLGVLYASSTTSTYSGGYFPTGVAGNINVV